MQAESAFHVQTCQWNSVMLCGEIMAGRSILQPTEPCLEDFMTGLHSAIGHSGNKIENVVNALNSRHIFCPLTAFGYIFMCAFINLQLVEPQQCML